MTSRFFLWSTILFMFIFLQKFHVNIIALSKAISVYSFSWCALW